MQTRCQESAWGLEFPIGVSEQECEERAEHVRPYLMRG